jgi:hypothetical protein
VSCLPPLARIAATVLVASIAFGCGGRAHRRERGHDRPPSRLRTWLESTPAADNVVQAIASGPLSLIRIAGVSLQITPALHDPLTALGACADLVTRCYNPQTAPLDRCVDAVPQCRTDLPWREPPCCPRMCSAQFHRVRASGSGDIDAFQRVYLTSPTCVPGVAAMIAEQP